MLRGVYPECNEWAQHDRAGASCRALARREGSLDGQPTRSMVKAQHVMPGMAPALAVGVWGVVSLAALVQRPSTSMATGCPVHARQKQPAAFQLVAQPRLLRGLG
jgi:hypothetical protein